MRKIILLATFLMNVFLVQSQNVGIGTSSPITILDVNSPVGFTSKFNGNSNQMYIGLFENNLLRGYLGSYAGAIEDVDYGTGSGNTTGKLHFTLQAVPKMTIDVTGNVGIGTTSPAASSLLDLSSTTKGILIPRMSSAQRTVIAAPALGLMVFDTDTKTTWAYDGTAWKNLYTSGGGLVLPFSQTVNTATSAFQVTNQGIGAAIEGASTNDLGVGTLAKTTGVFGWGLYAFSNRPGANSIYAVADSGAVFHGENNYPGNTNTLMSLLNRGVAKTSTFQLTNNSSTSANVQIAGNNLAEQLLVFQTNVSNTLPAVSISNSGSGAGLSSTGANGIGVTGTSTNNIGVKGVTNTASTSSAAVYGENNGTQGSGVYGVANFASGSAVKGESNFGTGVNGYSGNYRGVSGSSISGTGLYGNSISGYGLEVVGNVKISGGNTNPSNGAVLTSDASGNAVWKTNRIAFGVQDVNTNFNTVPNNVWRRIHFAPSGYYDFNNNYNLLAGANVLPTSSCFTAPINGIYHFDAAAYLSFFDLDNPTLITDGELALKQNRNGAISTLVFGGHERIIGGGPFTSITLSLSRDLFLFAGDILYVEVTQSNSNARTIFLGEATNTYFNGHLVLGQ